MRSTARRSTSSGCSTASVDPLVGKTGQPYLYANGSPVTLTDVSGLVDGCEMTQTCPRQDSVTQRAIRIEAAPKKVCDGMGSGRLTCWMWRHG